MSASGRPTAQESIAPAAKWRRGGVAPPRVKAWDRASAESEATHGRALLVRQEAHRIARTLAILDGARPGRVLEVGTGYLTLVSALRDVFPDAVVSGFEHPASAGSRR